jgi:hypothetical protein
LWENATSLGGALSEGVVVSLSPDVEIVANVLGGMIAVRETPSRVVFDGSFVRLFDAAYEPDFFTSATNQDNEFYLQNLANWLTLTMPVSVSGASWGRVKSAYR